MTRLICLLMMITSPVWADTPKVVTDIAPVGSIVARVMQGVGEPSVLVPHGASPHDYALRPSEARLLSDADLVVWVGPALTRFLEKPIAALASDTPQLVLMEGPVTLLPFRANAFFDVDAHDHDHEDEEHGIYDPHLWLDPANAVVIAGLVTDALAAQDPENKSVYQKNFQQFATDMEALIADLTAQLRPLEGTAFVVLHDAFHYFEARFHLEARGAVMDGGAAAPGPARLTDLRDRMAGAGVVCAFAEPQMNASLIETVFEGQSVRIATLNPMGDAALPLPEQYPALLRSMADTMKGCLGQK